MSQLFRPSFLTVVALIFLLPIFFIPGGTLDFGNAKALLIVVGTLVAAAAALFEVWRNKELTFPKQSLLVILALLLLVYFLSALLSTPTSLALLGYNFEVGTFGSILIGGILLFLASFVFSDSGRALQASIALFSSFSLLVVFAIVKILSKGSLLVLGNFSGTMGNPLGSWTDLAIAFGLLSLLSILAMGMLPMKRSFKAALYTLFLVSTILLVVIGFPAALALTLGGAVLLFVYFSKVEKDFAPSKGSSRAFLSGPVLPLVLLAAVSLLFLVNPKVSTSLGTVGEIVSRSSGVSNSDIHPTLSTTLSISKAVLSQNVLLGSGPNTFNQDWLIHKPTAVNTTPFWSVEFPFGAGFIPTQVASTGIVGIILWILFFILLLGLAGKSVGHVALSRAARFTTMFTLIVSLFIWAGSFVYTPSAAMLTLAFTFTGIFVGLTTTQTRSLKASGAHSIFALSATLVLVAILSLGWMELTKTLGAFHFRQAATLSSIPGTSLNAVSSELDKAVKFAPLDVYYSSISRLNFSKAQTYASSATGTPEKNRALFEETLSKSIQAARSAVAANPSGYGNWVSLGSIYSSLVAKPLAVEGAYESAQFAYNEAFKRNPANPELPLLLAQLEINKENLDQARSYIRSSLALKDDYAEGYLLLARLEAGANNIPAAIASAEKLATLSPGNAGIYFEIGVLKYSIANYQGAAEALTQALKLSPSYANAKYYLALSVAKLGRKEEAKALLEELLTSNPGSAELEAALKDVSKK